MIQKNIQKIIQNDTEKYKLHVAKGVRTHPSKVEELISGFQFSVQM